MFSLKNRRLKGDMKAVFIHLKSCYREESVDLFSVGETMGGRLTERGPNSNQEELPDYESY